MEGGTADTSDADFIFTGDALSHNFPSVAQVYIEVLLTSDTTATIALSSSDGTGATTTTAQDVGDGRWMILEPIFMGTGWGATRDPFNQLDIQRSLIIAEDGTSAVYQDMGADIALVLVGGTMYTAPDPDPDTPPDSSTSFVSVVIALYFPAASVFGLAF